MIIKRFILALILVLFQVSNCLAAITEKYVSDAGSGTADGSSEANAMPWDTMITTINAGGTAGNRYNVIRGAGVIARTTTTQTISGSGTATSPVIIRGYKTAITDGYQSRTSSNAALITTNHAQITYTTGSLVISGSWIIFESFDVSGAKAGAQVLGGPNGVVTRNNVTNSANSASAIGISCHSSATTIVYNNDATLSGSAGSCAIAGSTNCRIIGNRIKGGPANGITLVTNAGPEIVIDNLIYQCGGVGIQCNATTNSPCTVYGNTIVSSTGDGIDIATGTTVLQFIANNMITDNGTNAIDGVSAANAIFLANNRLRDTTTINSATDWVAATSYNHVTTDTGGAATDYTNSGSQDYTLINASPAKAVGHFPFRDIGALQRQEPAGGGVSRSRVVNQQ